MNDDFAKQFNLRIPVIQAPMGGIATPKFVAAAAETGMLASLPLGYLTIAQCVKEIRATQQLTTKPFAVNIFLNPAPNYAANLEKISAMKNYLRPYYEKLDLEEPLHFDFPIEPTTDELIDVILAEQVQIISFTFGALTMLQMQRLKQKNIYVMGTATTVAEAQLLAERGCDAVVAQGKEAGGHRGTFLNTIENSLINTFELVKQIKKTISLPVIAAGGIMTGIDVVTALQAGASAVQMGTALITCAESDANNFYKETLLAAKNQPTQLTTVFTGKTVRCLQNQFSQELTQKVIPNKIPDYPIQHYLTRNLRRAAIMQHNANLTGFWAGEGVEKCRNLSICDLVTEIEQAIQSHFSSDMDIH